MWEVRKTILCGMSGKDCQGSLFAPLKVDNHCGNMDIVVKDKYCVCKAPIEWNYIIIIYDNNKHNYKSFYI